MKRRASLTLIEMVISLGLLSFLLSALFYWYHSLNVGRAEFLKFKNPLLEDRFAYQRLYHLVPQAQLPFCTTAHQKGVAFIFDRGPANDPLLAGKILGKLYWDEEEHRLCLAIWPYPQKEETPKDTERVFTLLDNVLSCSWEFYSPPLNSHVNEHPVPQEGWQKEWDIAYDQLPAFVKLRVSRPSVTAGGKPRELEYFFDLPVPLHYYMDE